MLVKMKWLYGAAVLLATTASIFGALTHKQESDATKFLSKEIEACPVRDVSSLNQCIKQIVTNIKPYFPYGISAWKVPPLEPMNIKLIRIHQENSGTRLKADFTNLLVYGLSQFTVPYVRATPERYVFDIGMNFPRLAIRGRYDIDGRVLILSLNDRGPFTANITDITAKADMKLRIERGTLRLHSTSCDFKFKHIRFHLDNLLGGSAIGESVNESLNASIDDLLRDFKPAFVSEINKIIQQAFEEALSHIPLAKWMSAVRH